MDLGCRLLFVVIMLGAPVLLLLRALETGSTATTGALVAVVLLGLLFVFILRHYKRAIEQRLNDRYSAAPPPEQR